MIHIVGLIIRNIILAENVVDIHITDTVTRTEDRGYAFHNTAIVLDAFQRTRYRPAGPRGCEQQQAMLSTDHHLHIVPENELSREAGIQIDPKTKGPVVNEMLETSLEGVFACGNVLHVHDLVDHVSEEAALAGIYAAEYVRAGQAFRESHSHGRQEV